MSLQPGTRLGPYEILSARGAGGIGAFYAISKTSFRIRNSVKYDPVADLRRRHGCA